MTKKIIKKATKSRLPPEVSEPNPFKVLLSNVEELDRKANAYLRRFEFMSTDTMAQRIHTLSWDIFKRCGEDYEALNPRDQNEISIALDGNTPYLSYAMRPGSLKKTMAISVVSVDAHLRNLLERLEGRTDETLDFEFEADWECVHPESQLSDHAPTGEYYCKVCGKYESDLVHAE